MPPNSRKLQSIPSDLLEVDDVRTEKVFGRGYQAIVVSRPGLQQMDLPGERFSAKVGSYRKGPASGSGPESQTRRRRQARKLRCSHRGLSLPDLGWDVRRAVRVFRTEVYVMPAGVGVVPIAIAVPAPRSGRLGSRFGTRRPSPGSLRIPLEMGSARGGRADRERRDPGTARRLPSVGVKRARRRWPTAVLVCQFSKSFPPRAELWIGRGRPGVYGGAGPSVGSRRTSPPRRFSRRVRRRGLGTRIGSRAPAL